MAIYKVHFFISFFRYAIFAKLSDSKMRCLQLLNYLGPEEVQKSKILPSTNLGFWATLCGMWNKQMNNCGNFSIKRFMWRNKKWIMFSNKGVIRFPLDVVPRVKWVQSDQCDYTNIKSDQGFVVSKLNFKGIVTTLGYPSAP